VPIQKSLSLQCGDVLHHRRLAGEPKMILDLARARRDTFLALLALNEIKDASLPLCQHEAQSFKPDDKASSNEHSSLLSFRAKSRLQRSRRMRQGQAFNPVEWPLM
jgi:hypothetical protein